MIRTVDISAAILIVVDAAPVQSFIIKNINAFFITSFYILPLLIQLVNFNKTS